MITGKKRKIIVTPLVQAVKHVPPPTLQASAILVLKLGLSSSPVHVISLRTTPTFLLQVCVILPILWREPSGVSAYKKAIVKMIDGDRECPFRPEWITKLNSPMNETLRYSFLFSFHFFFFFFFSFVSPISLWIFGLATFRKSLKGEEIEMYFFLFFF